MAVWCMALYGAVCAVWPTRRRDEAFPMYGCISAVWLYDLMYGLRRQEGPWNRPWTGPAAWKPTPIVHSVVSEVSERIARCREELWWSESCASVDFHIFNMPHGQLIDVWAAVYSHTSDTPRHAALVGHTAHTAPYSAIHHTAIQPIHHTSPYNIPQLSRSVELVRYGLHGVPSCTRRRYHRELVWGRRLFDHCS